MAADGDLTCTLVFESNELVRYKDTYKRAATATIDRGGLPWRTIAVLANWVRDHDDVFRRAELEVLGSHLYSLLFAGDVGTEFETSHEAFRAAGFGGRVRIELCFYPEAEELAKLPWEFLYSPGRPRGFFLAGEDRRLVLTRLVPKELSAPPVEAAKHPLRVLVVTCHGVAETGSYVQQIKSAISSLIRPGDIELTPLDDPTFDELCDAVDDEEHGRPDVLHLIAHGKPAGLMMKRTVDPDAARTYSAYQRAGQPVPAALADEVADEVLVDARTVKGAFENHQPHLVLLHACDGDAPAWNSASADAPPLTRLFTTAREVAYAGVPAVVAMQYPISIDHALIFVKEFYEALARGASVGDAARNGRKKLARDSKAPGVLEEFATRLFGAPVVYVQQDAPLIAAQETSRPSMPADLPADLSGDGRERTWRELLDSGMAIADPAGVDATSADWQSGRLYAEWELLVEPGFLRELSLTPAVTGLQLSATRSVLKPLAAEVGVPLPLFRLAPDPGLLSGCFRVRTNLVMTAPYRGIPPDMVFAYGGALGGLDGTPCVEPLFGVPGLLLPESASDVLGERQLDSMKSLSCFFSVLIYSVRDRAGRLLTRQRVDAAVEALRQTHATAHRLALDDLSPGILHETLRSLAEEAVPVRSLPAVIDLLLEYELCGPPDAPDRLAWVRGRMRETIGAAVATGFRTVEVSPLPPAAVAAAAAWESSGRAGENARTELMRALAAAQVPDQAQPLLVPHGLRRGIWEALRYRSPGRPVLSFQDLPADFTVSCTISPPAPLVEAGLRRASADDGRPYDAALLQAWLASHAWEASAEFLRQHATDLFEPGPDATLSSGEDAIPARHQAILRLARELPVDDVAGLLTSPAAAAGAVLDAIDEGDLRRLALLLTAAPSISATAAAQALIAATLALAVGEGSAARDYAAYIAGSAPEPERRRCASLLRSLAAKVPDMGDIAEITDILGP